VVQPWIIATRSRGKIAELRPLLADAGIVAIGLDDAGVTESADEAVVEVFATFEENAVAKAQYFAALTGRPCLADDSGLCVDALDGLPGVRSRRFAADLGRRVGARADEDSANTDALIDACWDSGWAPPWSAYFACAAAYADGVRTVFGRGRTEGAIQPERDGDGGFGYDPVFLSADLGMTFAVASRDAKSRVSHRARAFAQLLTMVTALRSSDDAR
jgi:XTP/dITP diphosphohydrolase